MFNQSNKFTVRHHKREPSPPVKYFYWPFQGGTSFVDHLCSLCLVFVIHCCFVVTWREKADLLALVCDVYCDFVTIWDRCCTWLYRFLILAVFLTMNVWSCLCWIKMHLIYFSCRDRVKALRSPSGHKLRAMVQECPPLDKQNIRL